MSSQTTEQIEKSNSSAAGANAILDSPAATQSQDQAYNFAVDEDRETLLKILHQMILIRRFEEKCAESYSLGKIGGFCHLYIGQEAVGVGAISALRDDDYVITSYREHGQAIAKGILAQAVIAEVYGQAGRRLQSQGGPMGLIHKKGNFFA